MSCILFHPSSLNTNDGIISQNGESPNGGDTDPGGSQSDKGPLGSKCIHL